MSSIETTCTKCRIGKFGCPLWLADLTKDGELVNNYKFSCPLEKEKKDD